LNILRIKNLQFRLSQGSGILIGCLVFSSVLAQESRSHTEAGLLGRYWQEARVFDPTYRAAVAARDAAERALEGSRAQLGPKVSLSVNISRTERVEESTNILGQRSEIDRSFESRLNQIQARQPIFRKRELVSVEQAESQAEASRRVLVSAEQDLAMRLLMAWTDVLVARENKSTLQGAAQAAKESMAETDRRYKAGDATLQEVNQEQAKLAQAVALIEDAVAQESIANQALQNIVGRAAHVPKHHSLLAFSPVRMAQQPRDQFLRVVEDKNPDIAAAKYQEYVALLEREKARSDRYPTLDAVASASQGRNDTLPTIKNEQRAGIQLSVPLYTHGAISAAVEQADANYRKAQAQTQATTLKVSADALAAISNLSAIQARINALEQVHQATLLTLRAQQAGLKAGISSRAEIAKTTAELLGVARQRIGVKKEQVATWGKIQSITSGFDEELLELIQRAFFRTDSPSGGTDLFGSIR
jgi:outer membrane protein TolC